MNWSPKIIARESFKSKPDFYADYIDWMDLLTVYHKLNYIASLFNKTLNRIAAQRKQYYIDRFWYNDNVVIFHDNMKRYIDWIPVITKKQEVNNLKIFHRYKNSRDENKKNMAYAARDYLLHSHMQLIISIAKLFVNEDNDIDDLVQEWSIWFMEVIINFDIAWKTRLSKFSIPIVLRHISNFVSDNKVIRTNPEVDQLYRRIIRESCNLWEDVCFEAIANMFWKTYEQITAIVARSEIKIVSLDSFIEPKWIIQYQIWYDILLCINGIYSELDYDVNSLESDKHDKYRYWPVEWFKYINTLEDISISESLENIDDVSALDALEFQNNADKLFSNVDEKKLGYICFFNWIIPDNINQSSFLIPMQAEDVWALYGVWHKAVGLWIKTWRMTILRNNKRFRIYPRKI